MKKETIIRVADWTDTPGPRAKVQGDYSAEEFLEKRLSEPFDNAVKNDEVLIVDLDGVAGYLPSFLEETFGGLARKYGTETVRKHLRIVCTDDRVTLEDAWDYIDKPRPPKRPLV